MSEEKVMDLNLMREWWSAKREENGDFTIEDCWDYKIGTVRATSHSNRAESFATIFAASGPLYQALSLAKRIIEGEREKTPEAMQQIESALNQARTQDRAPVTL